MNISVNKRLIEFLRDKDSKQKELAEELVLSDQQVSKWFNLKEQIPEKHFIKIIKFYPTLPARWFITGEGSMDLPEPGMVMEPAGEYKKQKDYCAVCVEKDERISEFKERIEELKERIEELKAFTKKEMPAKDSPQYRQAANQ